MDDTTVKALAALNRRFYARFAAAFSASRSRPWPGWERVISHLGAADDPFDVLDVGCGNGRFALYLDASGHSFRYLGLDENTELLGLAAEQLSHLERPRFLELELSSSDLGAALDGASFHLIALFGVLHHVPGTTHRLRLLTTLARRLEPGGLLAASVWRSDLQPGFQRKVLPWETYNRQCRERGEPGVDPAHLEPGDTLLTWSGDQEHPRYCHFPTEDELEGWLDALGLLCVDRFDADGKSRADNLYLVLRNPT